MEIWNLQLQRAQAVIELRSLLLIRFQTWQIQRNALDSVGYDGTLLSACTYRICSR